MTIYDAGTLSVQAGSHEVAGLDTSWLLSEVRGGILFFGDGSGLIKSVEANDRLTLALPWSGRTGRGRYSIALSTAQAASAVVAFERLNDTLNALRGLSMLGRQVGSAATADAMRRLLGVGTGNLKIDAAGTFAQRPAQDGQPAGFTYLATNQSAVYVRVGAAGWAGPYALAAGKDGRETEISQAGGYIVWRFVGETSWRNVVALDMLRGADGADGSNVELRRSDAFVQWRVEGGNWANLIALDDIRGDAAASTFAAIEAADRAEAAGAGVRADADRASAGADVAVAKADEAGASSALSQAWAENPDDEDVAGPGTRSARHHAREAARREVAVIAIEERVDAAEARVAAHAVSADGSALAASASQDSAETARDLAKRYANDPNDVDIEEAGTRSSKFFAAVSRGHSEDAEQQRIEATRQASIAAAEAQEASAQRQHVDGVKAAIDIDRAFVTGEADRGEAAAAAAAASAAEGKESEDAVKASELATQASQVAAAESEANTKASEVASKESETNSKASESAAAESAAEALAQAQAAAAQREHVDGVKAQIDLDKLFVTQEADRGEAAAAGIDVFADRAEAAADRAEAADASTHPMRRDNPHEVHLHQVRPSSIVQGGAVLGARGGYRGDLFGDAWLGEAYLDGEGIYFIPPAELGLNYDTLSFTVEIYVPKSNRLSRHVVSIARRNSTREYLVTTICGDRLNHAAYSQADGRVILFPGNMPSENIAFHAAIIDVTVRDGSGAASGTSAAMGPWTIGTTYLDWDNHFTVERYNPPLSVPRTLVQYFPAASASGAVSVTFSAQGFSEGTRTLFSGLFVVRVAGPGTAQISVQTRLRQGSGASLTPVVQYDHNQISTIVQPALVEMNNTIGTFYVDLIIKSSSLDTFTFTPQLNGHYL